MIKKLALALVALVVFHGVAFGYGIQWSSVNGWLNYSNGVTALNGDASSSVGCFVQLIWAGVNGTIDQAYYGASIDGTGYAQSLTDDQVVDFRWVGAGGAGGADGWFDGGQIADGGLVSTGRTYFLRGWSAPASSYASGYVPASGTNYYFNSPLWTYQHSNTLFDAVDFTVGGGNLNTTLSPLAIPEPAVFGLGLIGLVTLRVFSRKRK